MNTETQNRAESAGQIEASRPAPTRFRQDKFRSTLHLACFQPVENKPDQK